MSELSPDAIDTEVDYDDTGKGVGANESELLGLIQSEFRASIGFENDADLIGQRETATYYSQGVMRDVPSLPNRSKAISTDVEDAIQTAMPDLIEIFAEGDDVVVFTPTGPDDEKAAAQESDYVRHVFFQQNDGFGNLYTYLQDALKVKTGIFTWWWEDGDMPEPKTYCGKTAVEVYQLIQTFGEKAVRAKAAKVSAGDQGDDDINGQTQALYDVTVQEPQKPGKCRIVAFDPNDFSICRDATSIADATYCARRSRPRAQDLIAMGIDPDLVQDLPTWEPTNVNAADLARDTVSETTMQASNLSHDLRQVYVVEHYLRRVEDGKVYIYKVLTDWAMGVVLLTEKVNRINIAAGTPFRNAHRFYGTSLADKLIEIQRIKTALWRMSLDSGYFALNQRPIVNMNQVNEYTLQDLLNNIPGALIRVNGEPGGAVQMAGGASLNYDPLQSLEYASTVAEQRTGIVRNAQGLSPDTLHDTATGAMALMSQAQKRLRLIARCLADGIRDAFLGIHSMLSENATQAAVARLRGEWLPINPSDWAQRDAMTIEIGRGAGNDQHGLMVAQTLASAAQAMVTAQGGINGPLQNPQSLRQIGLDMAKALGKKDPEKYFPDPAQFTPPPAPPNPDMLKLQLQQQTQASADQLAQQKLQQEGALGAAEQQRKTEDMYLTHHREMTKIGIDQAKLNADTALKHAKDSSDAQTTVWKTNIETGLAQQQLDLERQKMQVSADNHAAQMSLEQNKLEAAQRKMTEAMDAPGVEA